MNLNLAFKPNTYVDVLSDGCKLVTTLMGAVKVIREYNADGSFYQETICHDTEVYHYDGYWNNAENAEYTKCLSDRIGTYNVRHWVLAHV